MPQYAASICKQQENHFLHTTFCMIVYVLEARWKIVHKQENYNKKKSYSDISI